MWPSRWMLSSLFALLTLTPAVGRTAVPSLQQPQAYAVVIGISQYREEAIPKVPYAVKDAEAIAQMLERQAGIPKTHIRLLTDAKATGNDLRTVEDWLKLRVKPESTVYVYYAGHGTPNPKTGEAYLVPWDGNPDYPSGLFPLNDLYAALSKLPAKDVVVLLDACFSGAQGRSVLAKGARPMVISVENPLLASGKVIVLAASTGNQISSDYDKAGHGLFTHAVLTGLHGAADKDKNGLVTLKELYPYVREQVAMKAVEELNREQTPVLLPGEEALGARSALPVALALPGGPESPKPSAALSQAEQELKALEKQERRMEEQEKQAALQRQIEEKKRRLEEKKKKLEVASLPSYGAPKQAGREITGKDGAPMVLVPEGEFTMGGDVYGDERPIHRVFLDEYYIDKYEVTTSRYAAFLQATSRKNPDKWNEASLVSDGNRPVIGVNWNDAATYCRHYGKRLPTEAEWEKAARGTNGRKYPWGNDELESRQTHVDKCCDWKGYATLSVVGEHDADKSPYGAYDMEGNVEEWVADYYDVNYYQRSPDRNPTGPGGSPYKAIRGGSWARGKYFTSSSKRGGAIEEWSTAHLGFRCAKTP